MRKACALGAALLSAVLGSCASLGGSSAGPPLILKGTVDPLALLDPGASAYLRLEGESALLLAPALVPAEAASSLAPLLRRTEVLAVGFYSRSARGDEGPGATMDFQAALVGAYPFRLISLGIGVDRRWKREGGSLRDPKSGIRATFPGPRLALASNADLEGMIERVRSVAESPLPPRIGVLGPSAVLLWVPDPLGGLVSALGLGKGAIPLRGFALMASKRDVPAAPDPRPAEPIGCGPAEDGARGGRGRASHQAEGARDVRYAIRATFLMSDPSSARLFRPALRLAWYALARSVFGAEAGPFLAADFALDGDLYSSSEIELSAAGLSEVLSSVAAAAAPLVP
jgi:hypothetical protein